MPAREIELIFDEGQLDRMRRLLRDVPRGERTAIYRTVDRIAHLAQTRIIRMVTARMNIKRRDLVARNIELRTRAANDWVSAMLRVTGRRIPLKDFRARQTRKGVSYAILRGQRKTLVAGFLQTMSSGHEAVFQRSGPPRISHRTASRTNRRRGRIGGMGFLTRPRLPISERYGPSVPAVVEGVQEYASGQFERLLRGRFERELLVQTDLVLARHQAKLQKELALSAQAAGGAA